MSLINDALKRAKAAQNKEEPASAQSLQFRPVEPAQKPGRPVWLIVVCVATTVVVAAILLKSVFSKNQTLQVEAKGVTAGTNAQATETSTAPPPSGSGALPPVPKPTTFQQRTQEVAGSRQLAGAPPAPTTPRLQGIVYHPTRPSAVISGKSVFVGDKFGDFRVTAITRDSATIVSSTETNVLTFEK